MTADEQQKSIGQAIDGVISALTGLTNETQLVAIRAACDHFKLSFVPTSESGENPPKDTSKPPTDIRGLKEKKSPNSNIEMACVVAYYLEHIAAHSERKAGINGDDIKKYFIQGDYPVPKAPHQVLVDAKAAGYFDQAERGSYKLNAVGYNLVAHTLPRESGVTSRHRKSVNPKTRSLKKKKRRNS